MLITCTFLGPSIDAFNIQQMRKAQVVMDLLDGGILWYGFLRPGWADGRRPRCAWKPDGSLLVEEEAVCNMRIVMESSVCHNPSDILRILSNLAKASRRPSLRLQFTTSHLQV